MLVWLGLLVLVLVLLYRLAKQHLWLILGGGGGGSTPNPFAKQARQRKGAPLVTNQSDRDKVLKQSFSQDKIPRQLDAIVIGSGIGGLTTAAVLAKMGKKVLVLEQHDQAGGCCHTFVEKGYEFDVGIHYIGEMAEGSLTRALIDQLTESGVEWDKLAETYDNIILGLGEEDPAKRRSYPVCSGRDKFKQSLIEQFPGEKKAVEEFFDLLKRTRRSLSFLGMLKLLPQTVAHFLISTGLLLKICPELKYYQRSLTQVLNELTDNKELKAVLAYSYGDYGTIPKEASFAMQAMLINHFMYGGYYPVGGASEIAFNIIPTIEAAGGRVLVRANVTHILMDNLHQRAVGVTVKQGNLAYDIMSPLIISDAGMMNTIKKLLPPEAVKAHNLKKRLLSNARPGKALMSIFVGLDGTKEELGLKPSNVWAFRDENLDQTVEDYMGKAPEDALQETPPLMFLSFPSTKDPTFNERYPGKTTCAIITVTPYEWFEQWKEEKALHRSQDYEDFKNTIANKLWEQVVILYPQLEGRKEYFEVGSPLTNTYYLGTQKGEVYGADHDVTRFSLEAIANMRPDIGIPGLFLTGQDVMMCGFSGAMYGGLLCAMSITRSNLMGDLIKLSKEIKDELKSKKD